MKKTFKLLFVSILLLALAACQGPEGVPGKDGVSILGETFQYRNVNFTPQNNYTFSATYNPPLENGDAILVYRLEAVDNGVNIWEPLPTAFFSSGPEKEDLRHRFNYTSNDVEIIVESSNYSAFGPNLLINQVFRVVIVPSNLIGNVDKSNINAVMKAANIKSVQKMN